MLTIALALLMSSLAYESNNVTATATAGSALAFAPSAVIDWQQVFGIADDTAADMTRTRTGTTPDGMTVSVHCDYTFGWMRANNLVLVWDEYLSDWYRPALLPFLDPTWDHPNFTTFSGHFRAPSTPTDTPWDGDPLMVGSGTGPYNIVLDKPVSAVGFRLSVRLQSDWIAALQAYDANGVLLAGIVVTATGSGGDCAGLENNPPAPCDDAPWVSFIDPLRRIARIEFSVNDPAGMAISNLYIDNAYRVAVQMGGVSIGGSDAAPMTRPEAIGDSAKIGMAAAAMTQKDRALATGAAVGMGASAVVKRQPVVVIPRMMNRGVSPVL